MEWLISVAGICTGNTMWLAGLAVIGIGIWGIRVDKKSVEKMVRMMSAMTGGKPKGIALQLKGLVDPKDRTTQFGHRMLILGISLLLIGCTLIGKCAG